MKVEVVEHHECEKPTIPMVEVITPVKRSKWYGKTYWADGKKSEYKYHTARWACPKCDAQWSWSSVGALGTWYCVRRTKQWKEVTL